MGTMAEEQQFLSLIGSFEHTIENGRLSIPSALRKTLTSQGDGQVVITVGEDGCLALYPLEQFKEKQQKLLELTKMPKVRKYIRAFNALACLSQIDSYGRIAIGKNLLEKVNIKERVTITGNVDRVELWDPRTYEVYMEDADELLEEGVDALDQ